MSDAAGAYLVLTMILGAILIAVVLRGQMKAHRERQRTARAQELIDLRLNKLQATMEALPKMIAEAIRKSQGR